MSGFTCSVGAVGRHRIESVLQDVFGNSFEVFSHDLQMRPTCANPNCGEDCECADGIFVSQPDDQSCEVRFCGIKRNDHTFDATGTIRFTDRETAVRAARCALRILQQNQQIEERDQQLEYFIQQVSGDLEEACWFRTMADEVAACRADDPLEKLCGRILPQLRRLLHARSVLILQSNTDDTNCILALDSAAEKTEEKEALALNLAAKFGNAAVENAFVWNSEFPVGEAADSNLPDWLDGFILVKIGTQHRHFGWLLALERQDAVGEHGQSRGSESEFGTHEATLMETAAVLLATHAANCELFDEQEKTLIGVVTAMVNALDARDPYTHGHSHRVALISQRVGRELELSEDEIEDIYLSGLLHDIGKIGVPDHILLKNGPLDAEERREIERHTVIGNAILSPVKQLARVLPGVLHHHEQIDGSGYPSRLKGDRIPLAGRILAVADAYDAMTTSRPYRNAMPVESAEQILLEGAGSHWDEAVIDAFFSAKADIENVYEQQEENCCAPAASALQYGRLEDVSHGAIAELSDTGMTEV